MISPKSFYEALANEGVEFFTGVPDSLLKEFCAYVDAVTEPHAHIIAANEGTAIGIGSGFFLATGKLPLVYLQNSGLGNAINPLLSLADPEVYSLPMVVLVGWRGMPGVKDEPQHIKQGRVTPALLNAIEVPWQEVDGDSVKAQAAVSWATQTARNSSAPVVLLAHKDVFSGTEKSRPQTAMANAKLSRERAIALISSSLEPDTTVVSTTGMISRELYEQRVALRQPRSSDFLTVGSMGHASQIALGIANSRPEIDVACIDGDGSVLMHMGGMATIGSRRVGNILHIVLNNGVHDSVGGQPTVSPQISFPNIARACGYDFVGETASTESEVRDAISKMGSMPGRRFLEVVVLPGSRPDLARPKESPLENRDIFTKKLRALARENDPV